MTTLHGLRTGARVTLALVAGAAIAALAQPALTAQARQRAHTIPQHRPVQDSRTWVGDLAIHVDARTGQARKPTSAEAHQLVSWLRSTLDPPTSDVRVVTRPDGTRQMHLQGRLGSVVLARPRGDGTMETRCVTSFDEAVAFLGLHPASAAAVRVK